MSILRIQLSNFSVFKKETRSAAKKMLRFDLTWRAEIDNPNPEIGGKLNIGATLMGCTAYVSLITGELYWQPPKNKLGKFYVTNWVVTPDLYQAVQGILQNSDYYKQVAPPKEQIWQYAEELKKPVAKWVPMGEDENA